MMEQLQKAIDLRKNNKFVESNELLYKLVSEYSTNASMNYQLAWSYDVLGDEQKAVPYYEKAINLGLSSEELEGALLKLGSTYRSLGQYEKSKETFVKGIELYPNNKALQVFYSMTLYNLKQPAQAIKLLLDVLLQTTNDEEILGYKKAIEFYSDKLDEVWE